MKNLFRKITLIAVLVVMPASSAFATPYDYVKKEIITLVGEKNCPYNCEHSYAEENLLTVKQMDVVDEFRHRPIQGSGYIIHIANAIYEPLGYDVRYIIMSQKKARELSLEGKYNILLSEPKRSNKFLYSEKSIGIDSPSFYTSIYSSWLYKGFSSLELVTLGLVRGEKYPSISSYIEANNALRLRIRYSDSLETNMRKLAEHRIDAILDNKYVIDYYRRIMGLEDTIVFAGRPAKSKDLYLAFSEKTPDARKHRDEFDKGLKRLRKSGELQSILDKYGIEDWEK